MKKIIVVEGDEAVREFICECLRGAGFEAVPCPAERAARLAESLPADAVVLALAGAQVYQAPLYRTLRDNPLTAFIPLILCTGRGNNTVGRQLGETPPYIVFKPFEPEFFIKVVQMALKESDEQKKT